jgi:hypothetical protein
LGTKKELATGLDESETLSENGEPLRLSRKVKEREKKQNQKIPGSSPSPGIL